jgi:nitrate/nitrite transporter NarK
MGTIRAIRWRLVWSVVLPLWAISTLALWIYLKDAPATQPPEPAIQQVGPVATSSR